MSRGWHVNTPWVELKIIVRKLYTPFWEKRNYTHPILRTVQKRPFLTNIGVALSQCAFLMIATGIEELLRFGFTEPQAA